MGGKGWELRMSLEMQQPIFGDETETTVNRDVGSDIIIPITTQFWTSQYV